MDEEILETAKSICACGTEDEALLKRLCAASAQALERELREGVAPEDCEGAFICASAWLAARRADGRKAWRGGGAVLPPRGRRDDRGQGRSKQRTCRGAAAQRTAADGPVYGRTAASSFAQ